MSEQHHYLIIDDDQVFSSALEKALQQRELSVDTASDGSDGLLKARRHCPNRIVLDMKLESESGLALIEPLLAINSDARILMLTGYSSISTAVKAMRLGAFNYLCKPARANEILAALEDNSSATDISEDDHAPSVKRLEWEHIQRVLDDHDGNISATARALGMHRRTLQRKLQKKPVRE